MSEVAQKEKKFGKKKLLVILLALLVLAGGTAAILALTNGGYGKKTYVEVSSFHQLQRAVEGAKDNRTVVLTADINMEESILLPEGVQVEITDNGTEKTLRRPAGMADCFFSVPKGSSFTLKGTAAGMLVLDGGGEDVLAGEEGTMVISQGDVTMEKIVVRGSNTEATYGSVLRGSGGKNVLRDSTFENNAAEAGGVVYVTAGQLEVDGCTFNSNKATFSHGGAVYVSKKSTLSLKNSTFTDNACPNKDGSYGGAVALQEDCTGTIVDCVFDGNRVKHSGNGYGGAVYVGKSSELTVSGKTEFKNNVAMNLEYALGGAIYGGDKSTVTIEAGVTFTDNQATHGGAIYNRGSTFVIDGAVFERNKTTIGHGGAIYTYNSGKTTLRNCRFVGNNVTAKGDNFGGAVAIVTKSELDMDSCVFDGNFVEHDGNAYGGAMYIGNASTLNATGKNVFSNNYAKGSENALGGVLYANTDCKVSFAEGTTFTGNYGSHGGALYIAAAEATVEGATFDGNYVYKSNGGAMMAYKARITLKNCTFKENKVTSPGDFYGGALAVVQTSAGTLEGCTFTGNSVDHTGKCRGGAVYVGMDSTLDVTASAFDGNYTSQGEDCTGGAIYANTGCVVTLNSGTTFSNNTSRHGGAVMITSGARLNATGVTFTGNRASGGGHGGAIMANSETSVTLNSCVFNKNSVTASGDYYGGAVAVTNESAGTVTACTFDGNFVENMSKNAHGGAIYVGLSSKVDLSGANSFSNNYGKSELSAYGGAIYANNGCTVTVGEGAKFTGNQSTRGGAMFANAGAKLVVRGAAFNENNAVNGGGAIYVYADEKQAADFVNLSVENSTFSGNHAATFHGGAVTVHNSGKISVKGSQFDGNYVKADDAFYGGALAVLSNSQAAVEATGFDGNYVSNAKGNSNGGAVYVGFTSSLDVAGGTFANNYVSGAEEAYGGAIYANDGCSVTVGKDTVFTANSATHGGAVFATAAKLNVTGAAFESNTAAQNGGAVYVYGGTTHVDGAKFDKNTTANNHGGALTAYNKAELTVKNSAFTANSVKTVNDSYGGAVAILKESTSSVENCVFDGNTVDNGAKNSNGGAVFVGGASALDVSGTSQFKNNAAGGSGTAYGGAIYANDGCTVTVGKDAEFVSNSASHGGAIASIGARINVNGTTLKENAATTVGSAVYYSPSAVLTVNGVNIVPKADAAVTDITVPNGKTLEISGLVALGNVTLGNTASTVKLVGAVEEGSTAVLIPAAYADGTKIVTAEDASLLVGIGGKLRVANEPATGYAWAVTDEGALKCVEPAVKINDTNYMTLAEALAAAQSGDVITLLRDLVVGETIAVNGTVPVVIDGNGKILTRGAGFKSAMIDVASGSELTLKNITVDGNKANVTATAAMITNAGTLNINGGTALQNAKNGGNGGAVYNAGTLNMTGALIDGCAGKQGMGIYNAAGGVAEVTDTEIRNCTGYAASGDPAGAIRNIGTLTLKNGAVIRNNSATNGAALYNTGTVTIEAGVTVKDNTSVKQASIYNGGTLNVQGGTFTGNSTTGNNKNNSAAWGGALINNVGTVNLSGGSISGNTVSEQNNAGDIYQQAAGALHVTGTAMDLTGVSVTGTVTVADSAVLTVGGSFKAAKVVLGDGAKVHVASALSGTLTLKSEAGMGAQLVTAADGVDLAAEINKITAELGASLGLGQDGKIYCTDPVAKIGEKAYATLEDALAAAQSGDTIQLVKDQTVNATLAVSGTLTIDGGGKTLTRGTALTAAMFEVPAGAALNIGNVTLDGNKANVTATAAMITNAGTLNINGGTTLQNAKNSGNGGAVYNTGTLTVTDALIDGCVSKQGMGIYNATGGVATVTGTTIQNSAETADNGCGAIRNIGTLTLKSGTVIENNTATNGTALYNTGTATVESGVTVRSNTAKKQAVIYNEGTLHVQGGTFTDNSNTGNKTTAAWGGALINNKGTVNLSGGSISGNTVNEQTNGGDIYMQAGTLNVTGTAVDLSGVRVNGTVTVADSAVLTVGGSFKATKVVLGAGAKVHVASALTEATAFTLSSAETVEGTQLVTAADGVDLAAAVGKINAELQAGLVLEDNGKIINAANPVRIYADGALHSSYATLHDAVAAVSGVTGSEVVIKLMNDVPVNATVTVSGTLTIDGGGKTLTRDSGLTAAMFEVPAGAALNISNVTLDGANVAATGALIANNGALHVSNAIIENGKAGVGAAVYNYAGTAALENTVVRNCVGSGSNSSGVIRNNAGATLHLTGTTEIRNNSATNGAALYNKGTATIAAGVTVSKNTSEKQASVYNDGTLTINGGSFTENATSSTATANANWGGGAIINNGGTLTINGGTFSANSVTHIGGGALYVRKGAVTLAGGTFNGNTAPDNDTIRVHADGALHVTGTAVDLSGVSVNGNVTVADNAVLTVGGSFKAAKVVLGAGAKVHVASALTEAAAFTLSSAETVEGTQLVTAADGVDLAAAVGKITPEVAAGLSLSPYGVLISDTTVSYIVGSDGAYKSSPASLAEAIAAAEEGDTVVLNQSQTVSETISVNASVPVTIDGNGNTLTRGNGLTAAMISVPAGKTLTLKNITLDGANVAATAAMVSNAGTLNIEEGTTLCNAKNSGNGGAITTSTGSSTNINGGSIVNNVAARGSAVLVNGTVTVKGGVVQSNDATVAASGAFHVGNGASWKVILAGGTITGNNGDNDIYVGTNGKLEVRSGYTNGGETIKITLQKGSFANVTGKENLPDTATVLNSSGAAIS